MDAFVCSRDGPAQVFGEVRVAARHYFSILAAQGPLPLPQHPSSLQGSSLKAAPALFSLSTLPLVTFTEVSKVKM